MMWMKSTSGTGEMRRLYTPVVWKSEQIRPSWKSKSSWENIKTQSSLEFGVEYADWIHLNNCVYIIETCGLRENLQLYKTQVSPLPAQQLFISQGLFVYENTKELMSNKTLVIAVMLIW